ncbi:MAG: hypothetical protein WD068_00200 [Candidatus Babeliales bacterium]
MNNKKSSNEQFVLSYELLALMQWIITHEPQGLKRIISKALSHGLGDYITESDEPLSQNEVQTLQHAIIEFLTVMDHLLLEVSNERAVKNALERNLMPALDQIDTSACDDSTIKSSLITASSKLERNPNQNAKDLLYKELLKKWNPDKKIYKAH